MSKSQQQLEKTIKEEFKDARKYARQIKCFREIKRFYPINTALKILEIKDNYFLTNETNFKTQINQKDFINLTK